MPLTSLMIRMAALFILISGALLFAAQAGLIGSGGLIASNAHASEDRVLASASRPSDSMTPLLPEIDDLAQLRLPVVAEPIAPAALTPPAGLDDPSVPDAQIGTGVELSELGLPCTVSVTATAFPAAIVGLDVLAPCRADAAVTITHSGLQIAAVTDALGLLTLDIPAFETPAFFSVTFDDGTEESVLVGVPDLRDFDRVGLTWSGDLGLELHAMEFGASFGEPGHVWQDAPSGAEAAIAGDGGFLTLIGTGDSHAQIYTLPRATLRSGDAVRLSIDAPVTEANCTRPVAASTLRMEAAGPVDVTELTFTVPACDAVGDVLVLQNLLGDLRLASN